MAKKKGSGRKKGASKSKKSSKKLSSKINTYVAKAKSFLMGLPMPVKLVGGAVAAIFAWNRVAQARAANFGPAAGGSGSSTAPVVPEGLKEKFRLRGLTGLGVYGSP